MALSPYGRDDVAPRPADAGGPGQRDDGDGAAREIHAAHLRTIHERADWMFVRVLLAEWAAAILIAPAALSGAAQLAAMLLALAGGCGAVALPAYLASSRPGAQSTRRAIAIGQAFVACL